MAVLLNVLDAFLWLYRLCCAAKLAGQKQRRVTQASRERICQGGCNCRQLQKQQQTVLITLLEQLSALHNWCCPLPGQPAEQQQFVPL
jgi:hypothetical protein